MTGYRHATQRRTLAGLVLVALAAASSPHDAEAQSDSGRAALSATSSVATTPTAREAVDLKALAGIQRWRVLLGGTRAVLTGHERLVAIHMDGRVIGTADGSREGVAMPVSWTETLRNPAVDAILVHNHPEGQSLSVDDLWQLAKPGVAAMVAVGHDGSLYVAAAGPRFDGLTFTADVYARASQAVERLLRLAELTNGAVIAPHRNHLVALSLARAGVIHYHAALGSERRASYNGYGVMFESIVNRTAKEIRARMAHADPRRPR